MAKLSVGIATLVLVLCCACSDQDAAEGPADAASDLTLDARLDLGVIDTVEPDYGRDRGVDAPGPDVSLPDALTLDLPAADAAPPDLPPPDLMPPDFPQPDLPPPDITTDAMCSGDASLACYPGPAKTKGVGLCKAGTQMCVGGLWSACAGAVLPKAEVCDGQDNNCDGAADEKLACVSTVAGTGQSHRDGPAAKATFNGIFAVAVASNGDLYVADVFNYRIRKVSGGQVSTFAGSGIKGYKDGPALSAQFAQISDLAVTAAGDLVVVDNVNQRVRKVSGGKVTTLAGDGTSGLKDGPAASARFSDPRSVLAVGNDVLVVDRFNHRIRKISGGVVSTYAGSTKGTKDGALLSAQFTYPWGLAADSAGAVYVGAYRGGPIRKISGGKVTSIAGSSTMGYKDGPASSARFNYPMAVAWSGAALYVIDHFDARLRSIASGQVSTLLGDGTTGYVDGAFSIARMGVAYGLRATKAGDLLIADTYNGVIRRVDLTKKTVSTHVGVKAGGYKDGPASAATFSNPTGLARAASGAIYVADQLNYVVRRILGGKVSTFAGTGVKGYKDGPAASAQFGGVTDVALGPSGEVYLSELINRRIRKIHNGQVTTVAGDGAQALKDGPALKASFKMPTALEVDKQGAIYVVDTASRAIRKVYKGQVSTAAGSGKIGYLDGPAATAKFSGPFGLALGPAGEIYVSDSGNRRVRLVKQGQVTTVAGDGVAGCKDGPALSARFGLPRKMHLGPASELYIADSGCNQIRKLHKGQVTTVGGALFVGLKDGALKDAQFASPVSVLSAGAKTLLVGDSANHRVRRIKW